MASKRTDIHCPSAIVPSEYQFVGIEHDRLVGLGYIDVFALNRQRIQAHMTRTGGTYASHQHGGNCMVCGAHAIYTALFYHAPTNAYVRTGFDCAAKLDMGDAVLFRTAKKAVDAARKQKKGKLKAEGVLQGAGLEKAWQVYLLLEDISGFTRRLGLTADTPLPILADFCLDAGLEMADVVRSLATTQPSRDERTICDIVGRLVQWGSISDKQISFLRSLIGRIEKRPELEEKRAAERASAQDVPTGRVKNILVEVLKVEHKDYGDDTRFVMTVKAVNEGWVAWGTVPAACRVVFLDGNLQGSGNTTDDAQRPQRELQRGDKIDLDATYSPSDRDQFGFFKRPAGKLVSAST